MGRDSDLSTIISNLHQSRQLVMPESQSRCEFKRSSLDVGLAAADEILGKRRVCSPNSSSECPLESKKARSESPKAAAAAPPSLMAPCPALSPDLLRARQEGDLPPTTSAVPPERSSHRSGAPLETSLPRGAFSSVPDTRLRVPAASTGRDVCTAAGDATEAKPGQMSAELIRQKELETLHRQRLLAAGDPLSLHPGLPPDHPALRSLHDVPEGHALRDELSRRNAMLVLRHNNAPLLSLTPGGGAATPPKEQPRRAGGGRKSSQARAEPQGEAREAAEARGRDGGQDCNDEEMKDSESDAEDKAEGVKGEAAELKECKEGVGKACEVAKELGEVAAAPSVPCSSSSAESPSHLLNKAEVKYLPPASLPAPQPLPFGFPYTVSPYFHAGEHRGALGGLGWSRDCVSGVSLSLALAVSPQVFREQAIDGETLPLLTEEHLLNNMGLKLGPALKIRSQVAKRLGRVLCMAGFPVALPLQPPGLRPPEREVAPGELRPSSTGSVASPFGSAVPASRGSPKQENGDTPKAPS
ncbi:hypothetical protein IHE44_0007994 [Lamprotornis superbus]|uniref:SAM11 protein n=1 Tax=Lamprotornis superbus TaxID=245042 RepID=A0A835NED8_9PASS|nr:hypothetical protein IHE44_0007994 [Lamprotornis superbus]